VVAAAEEGSQEMVDFLLGVAGVGWTGQSLAAAVVAAARGQHWVLLKQLLEKVVIREGVVGDAEGQSGAAAEAAVEGVLESGAVGEAGEGRASQEGEGERENLQPMEVDGEEPLEGAGWIAEQLQPALKEAVVHGAVESVKLLLRVPLAPGSSWPSGEFGTLVATAAEQQQWHAFEALLGVEGGGLTREMLLGAWDWAAVRHLEVGAVQQLQGVQGVVWEVGDVESAAKAALRAEKWPLLRVLLGVDWDRKIKEEWYEDVEEQQQQQEAAGSDQQQEAAAGSDQQQQGE
jgi:hypothetical protein